MFESHISPKPFSWTKLVDIEELYVLILLGYYLCLNFSCCVRCTTDQNEHWCACESPKCSQVGDLFDHCRACGKDCQKCWTEHRYPTQDLFPTKEAKCQRHASQNSSAMISEQGWFEINPTDWNPWSVEVRQMCRCLRRHKITVLMNAAVLLPGRTSGIDAPWRFNCSLTSSGSNWRKV